MTIFYVVIILTRKINLFGCAKVEIKELIVYIGVTSTMLHDIRI